ncbi:hypothetical protein RchiOBHm_Chr3g0461301 [Rosa chinensis]|uniref:Uncharacterized protein n=1 Tax=Rosa chinensis TaxID=74649 RepID=A0A2P6R8N3_ROSCH|nr:hypothetical protein RchiOBHm_Chr3g0461301 [Rosa chinensis]
MRRLEVGGFGVREKRGWSRWLRHCALSLVLPMVRVFNCGWLSDKEEKWMRN